MKRIVALDPGGTTGIAVWSEYNPDMPDVRKDYWDPQQIGPDPHHLELWRFLNDYYPDVVVCESFEFRQFDGNRAGINLISREYIGVAILWGKVNNRPVVLQSAGTAKGFIPDKAVNGMEANAKLKVMGLYKPSMKHAMDATRHLIYYMVMREGRRDLVECWKTLR